VTVVVRRGSKRIEEVIRLMPVDPKINFEYLANRDANVRQIRRVLGGFDAVTGASKPANANATGFVWNVVLRGDAVLNADHADVSRFRIVHKAGESARLERVTEDGTGPVITFDDVWAEKPGGEMLLPQRQMACNALYYLQDLLITRGKDRNIDAIEHVGADAPIASSEIVAVRDAPVTPWEVLSWQTSGGLTIKISFDPVTGDARRVRAIDPSSDQHMSIELRGHQELGDVTWPRTLDVEGLDYHFSIEVLSVERIR